MVMVYILYAFYSGKMVILKVKNKLIGSIKYEIQKKIHMKIFFFTDGFYVISSLFKESHLHVTIKSLTG